MTDTDELKKELFKLVHYSKIAYIKEMYVKNRKRDSIIKSIW